MIALFCWSLAVKAPAITIHYCSQCNWLLRAGWMAQELLHTFGADLASVTLVPGTGGIYQITVDGHLLWDRKADGGFPEVKELKQRVRNYCFPERDLGHLDRTTRPE
ncbi:SelT/SelW/SelH family protein [Erwinia sp. CGal63]